MKTDTFIEIGSQHQMCEDYIISGDNYIILADGCSSSDHSEMGARFLCYMAKQFIKTYGLHPLEYDRFVKRMGIWIIHNAEMLSRHLGLNKTCLDATLVIVYVKDESVHVHMYGDGYLVLDTKWNSYEVYCVDYKSGHRSMPYYLRYLIDEEGQRKYHEAKVTKTVSKITIPKDSEVIQFGKTENAYDHIQSWQLPVEGFNSVSICSDGLGTFLTPEPDEDGNKIIGVEGIVPHLFDFRNSAGVFLQRQANICKRKLKKEGANFEHFDDLSIGTFLMEEPPDAKDGETE